MAINSRTKKVFPERGEGQTAPRSFSFDEVLLVARLLEPLLQPMLPEHERPQVTLEDALGVIAAFMKSNPDVYRRGLHELLMRLASVGVLRVQGEPPRFQSMWSPEAVEWGIGMGPRAYGLPYVAHCASDIVVRIHNKKRDSESIGSGVVVGQGKILTNYHVVKGAESIAVSWAGSEEVTATRVQSHPEPASFDMAVVYCDGFETGGTYPFSRPGRCAENVCILGYPSVPTVQDRPLLTFLGNISTSEPAYSYLAKDHNMVVASVMPPGVSGGGIFAEDGFFVGLAKQNLAGVQLEDGSTMATIFYSAIPMEVIWEQLPKIDESINLRDPWGEQRKQK